LKLHDARNVSVTRNLNFAALLLKALHTRLGSCIEKARPYYEALEQMMRAQAECQQAAVQFQRAAGQCQHLRGICAKPILLTKRGKSASNFLIEKYL
jgi:hypothetical protein